jgi:hypothetical protein
MVDLEFVQKVRSLVGRQNPQFVAKVGLTSSLVD